MRVTDKHVFFWGEWPSNLFFKKHFYTFAQKNQ